FRLNAHPDRWWRQRSRFEGQGGHSLEVLAQLVERELPGGALIGDEAMEDAQGGGLAPPISILDRADDGRAPMIIFPQAQVPADLQVLTDALLETAVVLEDVRLSIDHGQVAARALLDRQREPGRHVGLIKTLAGKRSGRDLAFGCLPRPAREDALE